MKKLIAIALPIVLLLIFGLTESRKRKLEEAYFVDKILSIQGAVSASYYNYEGTGFLTIHTTHGLLKMEDVDKSIFSDLGTASLRRMGEIEVHCSNTPNTRAYGVFNFLEYINVTLPNLNVQGLGDVIENYDAIYQALEADLETGKDLPGVKELAPRMMCRAIRP